MHPDDIDHALLASYLAGECSDAEGEEVGAWLARAPENAEAFRGLAALWRTAPSAAIAWNVDTAWKKVHAGLREQPRLLVADTDPRTSLERATRSRTRRFLPTGSRFWARSRSWIAAAAAACIVGASAIMYSRFGAQGSAHTESPPMREIVTAKGQRASVRLSDGTRVSLGVDSKLYVASIFGVAARDVYLEGEAFFDVTHNPQKPFVVHAGTAVTRVLGTKFGLRAYAGDAEVRVVVAEGRVRLQAEYADSNGGVVLARNQLGRLMPDGQTYVQKQVDVQPYLDGVNGQITFENAPLGDVMRELEHWYDVNLGVADSSLNALRFTAAFSQESLDVVIRTIARTLDLDYRRTGSVVVFVRHPRVNP